MFLVVCANLAIDAFVRLPPVVFGKAHRALSGQELGMLYSSDVKTLFDQVEVRILRNLTREKLL